MVLDNLTDKRGRVGSMRFAKRASSVSSAKRSRPKSTVGASPTSPADSNTASTDGPRRRQFSFRRRSVEALDNRKSVGGLGTSPEDRAVPIALYKAKYLGEHTVDTATGNGKVKGGAEIVLDAALQAIERCSKVGHPPTSSLDSCLNRGRWLARRGDPSSIHLPLLYISGFASHSVLLT